MKPGIALIGPGKVGCAVARRLYEQGYPLLAVVSRDRQRAVDACRFIGCPDAVGTVDRQAAVAAEVLLLAVPDDQIAATAAALQTMLPHQARTTLIHFSGLYPAAAMRVPGMQTRLLSLHPLYPFASRTLAVAKLSGCPCALEGDAEVQSFGAELVEAIGGKPFHLASETKPLYHAAACIASNYLVTLLDCATQLLMPCGIERQDAIHLLFPLLQATLDNCAHLGPERGLTGPLVRGDSGTISTHLDNLRKSAPQFLALYCLLGEKTLELAERSERLPTERAAVLQRLFEQFTASSADSTPAALPE